MKKAIGITLSVIGIIMAAINLVFKVNEQMSVAKSVSVIGGADGPTSIFVAGKIGGTPAIIGIIVGIVLLAIGIFIFARKNKFHFERVIRMKKIMFGNSLMLFGIALLILAGLEIMLIYVFWPAVILVLAGFMMAVIGYFSKGNKHSGDMSRTF